MTAASPHAQSVGTVKGRADVLRLESLGFRPFPCNQDKSPRVRWKDEPPEGGWSWAPNDLVGVPVPTGGVVIDVDDAEAVGAAGLELPETVRQGTRRGPAGLHAFYRTDGRDLTQASGPGYDLRVGGKGYVIAWEPDRWQPMATWAMAPEWVYETAKRPKASPLGSEGVVPEHTRDDWLASLAGAMRDRGLGYDETLAVLRAVAPRVPSKVDADFVRIARSYAKYPAGSTGINPRISGLLNAGDGPARSSAPGRSLRLTPATDITPRRVRWLWDGRLAIGTLALIGGREGTGKTIATNALVADITQGRLPGEFIGQPRNVVIVTTEDSWAMTIVPRLMAAGADLTKVYRAEAESADGVLTGLSLPHDLEALAAAVQKLHAAIIILDPLISRLDATLDTHKDAEVRLALEPLVALAERTQVTILGLIHVNKSSTTDPLTMLMASRAFPAVARAVLFVMDDPDEPGTRLLGQPKNNLGRTDLPTLRFEVEEVEVGTDPEDGRPIMAGKVTWLRETKRSLTDALAALVAGPKVKTQVDAATEWLVRYLNDCEDGKAASEAVKAAASRDGIGEMPLKRARERLDIDILSEGFPRHTFWQLPNRLAAFAS